MRARTLIFSLGAAAVLSFGQWVAQPKSHASEESAFRIGTFRRTELLVAYYGSTVHDKAIKKLKENHDRAQSAGDLDKVKELEAQGGASQELAHRQLAGEAPLTNVLEQLKDALPAIAKEASVVVIVEQPLYRDPSVREVDVTPWLVKKFEPARKKTP